MAIDIISGFFANASEPVDVKKLVADSTERLELTYPYVGLTTKQLDTGEIYEYVGTPPSNTAADWQLRPSVLTGTAVPDNANGVDGDLFFKTDNNYFYEKVAGVWTLRADLTGAQIFQGTADPNVGDPGVDGDLYVRDTGDVYQKSGGSWGAPVFNIAGTDGAPGDRYSATSATNTVNIPQSHPTDVALTLDASDYAYTPGQSVVAAEDSTNFFEGTVKSYVGAVLTITSTSHTGTGSAPTPSWTVNLDGATGQAGASGKAGVPDKTYTGSVGFIFNDQEVLDIQNNVFGTWTVDNPFLGYIVQDDRETINSPGAIAGEKDGHLVSWNGSAWTDVGEIRGPRGFPATNGWSPVLSTEQRGTDEQVLKITGWIAGSGDLPSSLSSLIGYYITNGALTPNINLATNIKGDKGDKGDASQDVRYKTQVHPASTGMSTGENFWTESSPPTVWGINFNNFESTEKNSIHTWNKSGVFNAEGGEVVLVTARASVRSVRTTEVRCDVHLSYNGTFDPSKNYGFITMETNYFPVMANTAQMVEVVHAINIPFAGPWQWRMRASTTPITVLGLTIRPSIYYSQPGSIQWRILVLHRDSLFV